MATMEAPTHSHSDMVAVASWLTARGPQPLGGGLSQRRSLGRLASAATAVQSFSPLEGAAGLGPVRWAEPAAARRSPRTCAPRSSTGPFSSGGGDQSTFAVTPPQAGCAGSDDAPRPLTAPQVEWQKSLERSEAKLSTSASAALRRTTVAAAAGSQLPSKLYARAAMRATLPREEVAVPEFSYSPDVPWDTAMRHESHIYLATAVGRGLVVQSRTPAAREPTERLRVYPATRPSNTSEAVRLWHVLTAMERNIHPDVAPERVAHAHVIGAEHVLAEATRQVYLHTAERGTLLGCVGRTACAVAFKVTASRARARMADAERDYGEAAQLVERLQADLEALGATARSLHRQAEQTRVGNILDKFLTEEEAEARRIRKVLSRISGFAGREREEAIFSILVADQGALDETLAVLATFISRLDRSSRCLLLHARADAVPEPAAHRIVTPLLNKGGGWPLVIDRVRSLPEMHRLAHATRIAWEHQRDPTASRRYTEQVTITVADEVRVAIFNSIGGNMRGREVQLLRPQLNEAEALADESKVDPVLAEMEAEETARLEAERIVSLRKRVGDAWTQTSDDNSVGPASGVNGGTEGATGVNQGDENGATFASIRTNMHNGGNLSMGALTAAAKLMRRLSQTSVDDLASTDGIDGATAWGQWLAHAPDSVERLALQQVTSIIASIYAERLQGSTLVGRTTTFKRFVYLQLTQRHGVKSAACKSLKQLFESAKVCSSASERVKTFASLCGVLPGTTYSETRITFFFDLLRGILGQRRYPRDEVLEVKRLLAQPDGDLLLPNFPAMPVTKTVCSRKELTEHADALGEYIESVSTVPVNADGTPARGAVVDADKVLMRALDAYDASVQSMRQHLLDAFHEHDDNHDGVLSIGEFSHLCQDLYPHLQPTQIEQLFIMVQDASDAIDSNVGDALLPEAFVSTVFANPRMLQPPEERDAALRRGTRRRGRAGAAMIYMPERMLGSGPQPAGADGSLTAKVIARSRKTKVPTRVKLVTE